MVLGGQKTSLAEINNYFNKISVFGRVDGFSCLNLPSTGAFDFKIGIGTLTVSSDNSDKACQQLEI